MDKLAILESKIPIKAIPEIELNTIILTTFLTWICDLLSLTDEASAKRLKVALPAIKVHCWSMGFEEIKKMFTMYADGNLSVKPMPNYFDRILLGKIVEAYKLQKPVPKKEINTINDMEEVNKIHLANFFKGYFITGFINDNYVVFAYDWLEKNGFIKLTKEEKLKLMKDSEVLIIIEKKESGNIRDKLSEFKVDSIPNEEKVFKSKKLALKGFLKNLDEHQVKEIEKALKL